MPNCFPHTTFYNGVNFLGRPTWSIHPLRYFKSKTSVRKMPNLMWMKCGKRTILYLRLRMLCFRLYPLPKMSTQWLAMDTEAYTWPMNGRPFSQAVISAVWANHFAFFRPSWVKTRKVFQPCCSTLKTKRIWNWVMTSKVHLLCT